ALMVSTLVATSPFFIWYSQEVRYITLMITAALFSMWAFWQALSKQNPVTWLVYAVALILALFTFLTCIFLIPTPGTYLLVSRTHLSLLLRWIVLQIPLFVFFLWWAQHTHYAAAIHERNNDNQQSFSVSLKGLRSGGKKELTPAMIPYTIFAFSAGFSVGPSL